jgi:toxin ParE1/3/4
VARVRYLRRAEDDLDSIAEYTLERWGRAQAELYVNELQALCERLDDLSVLNRPYRGPYLRRAYESHLVYFRRDDQGDIVIVRILGKRMLPELHLDPERDDPDEDD